jgi:hypothetical protein
MRFAPWAALLAVVFVAAPSPAQYWGSPGGRRVAVPGFVVGIPGFGYGFVPAYSMMRPVVVVVSPPRVLIPLMPPPDDEPPPAKEKEEKEKPIPFDPDGVLVVRPKPGGVKALPPPRQMPEPPPKVAPPNANVPPIFDPPARQAPPPEKDKAAEAVRQIKLGRAAFADGEYGRAAERFRQASTLAPDEPASRFLSAQALFAMGKYRESVAAICDGMKMMPDWPKEPFPPREMYGEAGRDFPLHLDRLRQSLDRDPANPALLFLYGYQLWFDGRRADARPYLQKAAAAVANPKPIELFLNELKKN